MRDLARLDSRARAELFRRTASAMQVHEAIVEKDFWVCVVLDLLFTASPWCDKLVFKGGTSLSKAYGVIERFSEDIDLVIDWRELGYDVREPWNSRSLTRQEAFNLGTRDRTRDYLLGTMGPVLAESMRELAGTPVLMRMEGCDLLIEYPHAFALAAIQPVIRLEIGPLAAWMPQERCLVMPYAAAHFPSLFRHSQVSVPVISAERTFWEKATILHQEAHRDARKNLPLRYSRHYYDLHRLALCEDIRRAALSDSVLLEEVVAFKDRFYRTPWARYDLARPGTLRLLPTLETHRAELRRDYQSMRPMLFGSVPSFDEVLRTLADLEYEINHRADR